MATASESLSRPITQYAVKFYIKNDSDTYVDFTDRFGVTQDNYLRNVGAIRHVIEGPYEQPTTRSITVTVDNSTRFWDATPPSGFDPWEGRDVQVRIKIGDVTSEVNLVTFRIAPDGIETSTTSEATIKLEPLTETLARVDADSIKHGESWYENRPWLFLASEILRTEFGDSSGDLPGSYTIPTDGRFTYPDGNKHFSTWGKPPQYDGTDWNDDNTDIPWSIDVDSATSTAWVTIGTDLWEFDIDNDTWTNRGEDATNGNGVSARACYVCDAGVVVCKWEYDFTAANYTTLYVNFWDTGSNQWDSTTKTSNTNFFPGTFWVFDGATDGTPVYRVRGYTNGSGFTGASSPFDYGTNVEIPFRQYVRGSQVGASAAIQRKSSPGKTTDVDWNGADWSAFPALPHNLPEQYQAFHGESGNSNGLLVQVAYGNKPNLAFDRVDSTTDAYLYFVEYFSGTDDYSITQLDIIQGSTISANTVLSPSTSSEPHSLTLDSDATHICYVRYIENADATGYDNTAIVSVTLSSLPASGTVVFQNTSLAENEDFITDILFTDTGTVTGDYLFTKMKAGRINSFPQFQLSFWDGSLVSETVIDSSMGYFCTPRRSPSGFPVVYQDSQSGAFKKKSAFDTSGPTLIDGGRPPVFDSLSSADFWASTGSDPDIYGLSRPYHEPDTQESTPDGKYYLYQYTTKHTGRVELADFRGLTKLDALSQLAQAFDHSAFPDRDGDWVIQARDPSTAASGTLAPERYSKGWIELKRMKPADIINYYEMVPYETVLEPMETKLYQRETSPFDGNVLATQLDTKEKRIKMRCIHGGLISNGSTRWDILAYRSTVETRLGAAYTSGTSVTLESVFDVAVGDKLEIGGEALKEITAVNTSTKVITIDSGLSSAHPIMTPCVIVRAGNDTWSSQGVTTLAEDLTDTEPDVTVYNAEPIGVGSRIIVGAEEMTVTAKDGNDLTVTRGDNNVAHLTDDVVSLVIIPPALGQWVLVGGYGITVRFDYDQSTETEISSGDYLEFICPGLTLEKRRGTKVIAANQSSINDYGKRKPRRTPDNRFMTFRLAEFYTNRRVTRYATQKKRFVAGMGMDVDHFHGNVTTLKSADLLPDETDNEMDVIVKDVTYRPHREGVQTEYTLEEQ